MNIKNISLQYTHFEVSKCAHIEMTWTGVNHQLVCVFFTQLSAKLNITIRTLKKIQ